MDSKDYAPGFSFDQLTQTQQAAVNHKDGPLLIIAGPGSGKTRVITCRIARLIQSGVAPYNICAITFTNKAANEMRERVNEMGVPASIHVSTFHSLCVRILRQYATQAGLAPNFSIYSDADQKKCIKDAIAACDVSGSNFQPSRVLNAISKFKNDLEDVEDVKRRADGYYLDIIAKVYEKYQKILAANNALDFDDLLTKTAFLLRDRPDVRQELSNKFKYLLVDEYQDTNHAQYQIAKGLALSHGNICVTGDPDQSVYRWRGADIGNILAFEKDWPSAKVVKLEENFRSTPEILKMADTLIAHNTKRKEKKLIPTRKNGPAVDINSFPDEQLEAQAVAGQIRKLIDDGADPNEIAVLYRVNSMSRTIEESFIQQQIPYSVVKGVEFYSRKEIRDMVAYLKLIANPQDNVALVRIINTPARGIGKTTVDRLETFANSMGVSMFEALQHIERIETINNSTKNKLGAFGMMVKKFSVLSQDENSSLEDLMENVYEESGLADSLKAAKEPQDTAIENIAELINSAARYDDETENGSLLDYLQAIALYSDTDAYDPSSGTVSLMTLHAAKGLEFDNAFIIGLEEGLLPHERSKDNPEEMEEERRLFFVGITRARRKLHISYAKYRTMRGMLNRTIPSKFLYEVGADVEGSRYGNSSISAPRKFDGWKSDYVAQTVKSERANKPEPAFKVNDLVKHNKFGLGRVKEYLDIGEKSVVTVKFNSGQTKALLLKYAKLDKVS